MSDTPQDRATAYATKLIALERTKRLVRALEEEIRDEQDALIREGVLAPDGAVSTTKGIVRRRKVRKGRRFADREALMRDHGELPLSVQPREDHKMKTPIGRLPTAIQAEILALGKDPEQPVVVEEAWDWPTVAEIEEEFGPESRYIGKPAAHEVVVLEIPSADAPDKPLVLEAPEPPKP